MSNKLESDPFYQTSGGDVNFIQLIRISLQNWKIILLGFLLGLALSTLYYLSLTDKYQSVALISMLKLPDSSGKSIEQPQDLVARMKNPTAYDRSLIDSCGLDASSYRERLSQGIVFTFPKGTDSYVELTITDRSEIVALNCMTGIVDMIDGNQFNVIYRKVQDLRDQISRLHRSKASLEKKVLSIAPDVDNSQQSNFVSAQFYSQILSIEREIIALEGSIDKAHQVRTTLVDPIYVSNMKFNGVKLRLFALISLGILVGFLVASMWPIIKKKIN